MNLDSLNKQPDEMEERIIRAARELFMERGFVETSMGDIASRIGVNRPAINYYFRTKERLFQAVLGSIVLTVVPKVIATVLHRDLPLEERLKKVVDIYYGLFQLHPTLPFFMLREINRDFSLIVRTVDSLGLTPNLIALRHSIEQEMEEGRLRKMPVGVVVMTFASLIISPFAARPLLEHVFLKEGEDLSDFLKDWKPNVVSQLYHLLSPERS